MPDQHADQAANEELEREYPPRRVGPENRGSGPKGVGGDSRGDPSADEPRPPHANGIQLRSAAFGDHDFIPERYSYEGDNISPPLEWSPPPSGTAELVLLCEDPDAPGGTFTHWVVTNIPAELIGFEEGALPEGVVVGRNDFGKLGWGGPRPPVGDQAHRYFFRLYAVDRPLDLGASVSGPEVRTALEGHELASGTLVGLFAR